MLEFLAVVVLILVGLAALIYIISNAHKLMPLLEEVVELLSVIIILAIVAFHWGWEVLLLLFSVFLLWGGIYLCLNYWKSSEVIWARVIAMLVFGGFMTVALIIKMTSSDG